MKGPVTSHRESCLHQARVFIQQARAHRQRWLKNYDEAMRMPEGGWFFELLDWSAQRREQAGYLPASRWWRMPGGLVFTLGGGFNGFACIDIPAFRAKGWEVKRGGVWYGVHGTTVRRQKLRPFLDRCEALGDAEPTGLIREQVRRLEALGRWQPHPLLRGDSYGDEEQPEPAGQLELFA